MSAYYNEFDPDAAQWLRNLIEAGHIAPGDVDERSIRDVTAADVAGYRQCHFFAGIGVWSYALRRAGWPDDREVWTGSCPCQPFSAAGKRGGKSDERHLWPEFFRLIRERRPHVVFGEQVASPDGLAWLDDVSDDLEGEDYAVGTVDTCAAGFGAPHIRQRLYFVADTTGVGQYRRRSGEACSRTVEPERPCDAGVMGDAAGERPQGPGYEHRATPGRLRGRLPGLPDGPRAGATNGFWRDADWLPCIDGKSRPVEPGTFPLAHGAPARVGRLRAYGNALNAEQAIGFISAYMEAAS